MSMEHKLTIDSELGGIESYPEGFVEASENETEHYGVFWSLANQLAYTSGAEGARYFDHAGQEIATETAEKICAQYPHVKCCSAAGRCLEPYNLPSEVHIASSQNFGPL